MKKLLGPVIIAATIGLALFFAFSDNSKAEDITKYFTDDITAAQESDYKNGAGNKDLTIIEYGDFQCIFCGQSHPIIEEVEEAYGDDISVVFRHFPLVDRHPNAMAGHRAAEAAGIQGKFYEMHDLLFERQQVWSAASNVGAALELIEGYASEINLDMEKYNIDVQSPEVAEKISAHQASGTQIGVTGTPTFFLNGERIGTPGSLEEWQQVIEAELAGESTEEIETTGEDTDSAGLTGEDAEDEVEATEETEDN